MSSVSYYSPVFKAKQPSSHALLVPRERVGKRKRQSGGDDDLPDELVGRADFRATGPENSPSSPLSAGTVASTPARQQTSGHKANGGLSNAELSHSLSEHHADGSSPTHSKIAQELAVLNPPLHINRSRGLGHSVESLSNNVGLRQQHLAVVATIMHRSIFEGDFLRAGRAWGTLLRSELSGRSMDPRTSNRWGLGSEISLQRENELSAKRLKLTDTIESEAVGAGLPNYWFSRQGFEKAKDYYERLTLQYPYRKMLPHAIGPLDFHLAMFGLWIRSVLDSLEEEEQAIPDLEGDPTLLELVNEEATMSATRPYRRTGLIRHELRDKALHRSSEIALRLEEFLAGPPCSGEAKFWTLKGMVALWRADLWQLPFFGSDFLPSSDNGGSSGEDSSWADALPSRKHRKTHACNEAQTLQMVAKEAFKHAVSLGGTPFHPGNVAGHFATTPRGDLHSARD